MGTWVVLRGLAFLGDALAHGVIPGIAIAVLVGFNPLIGAFIAALVMSGLVSVVSNRTTVRDDTAIGLLFVGMLALGIIIVSRARSFATEVTALLFGNVFGVTTEDIRNQLIATVIVVLVTVVMYRPFLALTFNRQKAQTLGMRPQVTQAVLLTLLTVSIVSSFQAIGTLCVRAHRWATRDGDAACPSYPCDHGSVDRDRDAVGGSWLTDQLSLRYRGRGHNFRSECAAVLRRVSRERSGRRSSS